MKKTNKYFWTANLLLWILCIFIYGLGIEGILISLLSTLLLLIGVTDWQTHIIPPQLNVGILLLGILKMLFVTGFELEYMIGAFVVSIPLMLLFFISNGTAIGGGDVKLMAAAGVFLGWKKAVLALFLGCAIGSFVHILRMKIRGADRVLALGPYLAAGILLAALFGEEWILWYLSL